MPSISLRFPLPANPEEFEVLCLELYKREWKMRGLQRIGRRGHAQWGIDLVGVDDQGSLRAVQCRLHEEGKKLTATEVRDIVKKATSFNPPLNHLTIATTASRDPKLQILAAQISIDHVRAGLFSIQIASWDDLQESPNWCDVASEFISSPTAGQGREITGKLDELRSSLLSPVREAPANVGDTIDAEIDQAAEFVEQLQPEVAEVLLERVERRYGAALTEHHRFRVAANRGSIAKTKEDFAQAARHYLEARTHSDTDKARYFEALAYLFRGESTRAYELGLALREESPAGGLGDAVVAMSAPQSVGFAELEHLVGPAVKANSNVGLALAVRALNEDMFDAAERHSRAVLESEPHSLGAKELLALAILGTELQEGHGRQPRPGSAQLGRVSEALALLQGLLRPLQGHASSHHLGMLHYHTSVAHRLVGQSVQSSSELGAAYALAPDSEAIAEAQAVGLAEQGHLDEAVEAFGRVPPPLAPRPALVLAQLLGQRGRKEDLALARGLLAAGTAKATAEAAEFRGAWATILVKLSLSLGDPQAALEDLTKLPTAFVDHASTETLRGLALLRAGRSREAEEAAVAAHGALGAHTPLIVREHLARLLARVSRHDEAVSIWRQDLEPTVANDEVRAMLASAHIADDEDLVLTFCSELRRNGVFDRECIDLELATAFRRSPNLAAGIAAEILIAPVEQALARHVRLFRAQIGLETNDASLADAEPSLLPAVDEVDPLEGHAVVDILRRTRPGIAAINYAYALLRRFPDNPAAAHALIKSIVGNDAANADLAPPERVAPGTAVRYSLVGDEGDQWAIIEDGAEPSSSQREFPPDHPLAQHLLGRRVGDEFFVREGPPQPIRGVVREILHKAVRKFHEQLATAEERFPETPVVQKFKLDLQETDPDKQLAPILAVCEERRHLVESIEDMYRGGHAPVGLVATGLSSTVFDVLACGFIGRRDLPLTCSPWTDAAVGRALQAVAPARTIVLDSTALFSLSLLQGLEALADIPLHLVVSENTLLRLHQAHALTTEALEARGHIASEAGRLHFLETPSETIKEQRHRLEEFIALLKGRVEVCAAPSLAAIERAKRAPLVEVLGRSEIDPLVLASANNWAFWTDDLVLATLGAAEFGVARVWTELVARWLGRIGSLTPHQLSGWVLSLLARNYRFTSLTADDVIHAARSSSWDTAREPLSSALSRIGDKEWDTPGIFRLAGDLIVRAWRASLSDVLAEAFTVRIAKELAGRPEGPDLVRTMQRAMDVFFGLDALNATRAKGALEAYLRSNT